MGGSFILFLVLFRLIDVYVDDEERIFLYELLLLHVSIWGFKIPFLLPCSILEQIDKNISESFFIVALDTCEQYRRCFTGQSGKVRLYYFVGVCVTYHVYCRKIVKVNKQGYKITLELCSLVQFTFRCVCAWNKIGLKVCIVYEVWFEFILIFITLFI